MSTSARPAHLSEGCAMSDVMFVPEDDEPDHAHLVDDLVSRADNGDWGPVARFLANKGYGMNREPVPYASVENLSAEGWADLDPDEPLGASDYRYFLHSEDGEPVELADTGLGAVLEYVARQPDPED